MSESEDLQEYAARHYQSHLAALSLENQEKYKIPDANHNKAGQKAFKHAAVGNTGRRFIFAALSLLVAVVAVGIFLNETALESTKPEQGPKQASLNQLSKKGYAFSAPWGIPDADIIDHHPPYYTLGFPANGKTANWICYQTKAGLKTQYSGATFPDPDLTTPQLESSDRRTGYVLANLITPRHIRGHEGHGSVLSFFAVKSLMKKELHRKAWSKIADLGLMSEQTWVTVGTLFDSPGSRQIDPIPTDYFIIFAHGPSDKPPESLAAYLIPNQLSSAEMDIAQFSITIDDLESLTQLDFFSDLPDQTFESAKTWIQEP